MMGDDILEKEYVCYFILNDYVLTVFY